MWSQAVGCLLMGVALGKKGEVERWGTVGPAVYVGWTTGTYSLPYCFGGLLMLALATFVSGLCGSITTFSSWMVQTFEAFSDFDGQQRASWVDNVRPLLPSAYSPASS